MPLIPAHRHTGREFEANLVYIESFKQARVK